MEKKKLRCCHLEILGNFEQGDSYLHFALGPLRDEAILFPGGSFSSLGTCPGGPRTQPSEEAPLHRCPLAL